MIRCSFRGWKRPIRRCPDDEEAAGVWGGFSRRSYLLLWPAARGLIDDGPGDLVEILGRLLAFLREPKILVDSGRASRYN